MLLMVDGQAKGEKCQRCYAWVPQFAELGEVDRQRILKLVAERQFERAQEELMACTGAPIRFAKI